MDFLRIVRAISIGPAAFRALRASTEGEVHSVFERVFNILIEGKLVGIGCSDILRSPINLITDMLPSESMPSLGIRRGMRVRRVGDRMRVGEVLEISLEDVKLWQPKTCSERCLSSELIKRNLEVVKQLAANKSKPEGLGQLLPHVEEIVSGIVPEVSYSDLVIETILPRLVNLVKSARTGDVRGVEESAQRLIGLGFGLSPSADDALAGFMAANWWIANSLGGDLDRVRAMNEAIVGRVRKTTLISQRLLGHAANGEVNEAVEKLLESILGGTAEDVKMEFERVSRIGETSGIDTVVGVLLGLHLGLSMYGCLNSMDREKCEQIIVSTKSSDNTPSLRGV
ncbi:MAG: DUF2877 domain-containing protein [Candidatus Bathyarchaeia archaeon]